MLRQDTTAIDQNEPTAEVTSSMVHSASSPRKDQGSFCLPRTRTGPRVARSLTIKLSFMMYAASICQSTGSIIADITRIFFADYSGFDGQAVVTNPDRILIDVTRSKLSQNARTYEASIEIDLAALKLTSFGITESIQVMNDHLAEVLEEIWTNDKGAEHPHC
jgi:hypothetical protein